MIFYIWGIWCRAFRKSASLPPGFPAYRHGFHQTMAGTAFGPGRGKSPSASSLRFRRLPYVYAPGRSKISKRTDSFPLSQRLVCSSVRKQPERNHTLYDSRKTSGRIPLVRFFTAFRNGTTLPGTKPKDLTSRILSPCFPEMIKPFSPLPISAQSADRPTNLPQSRHPGKRAHFPQKGILRFLHFTIFILDLQE